MIKVITLILNHLWNYACILHLVHVGIVCPKFSVFLQQPSDRIKVYSNPAEWRESHWEMCLRSLLEPAFLVHTLVIEIHQELA